MKPLIDKLKTREIKKDKEGFQTANIALIGTSHFLHDVYTSFLAPALPFLIEKLGITYGLAGLLHVIQRIPSLLNPFVGMMADRMSMRYLVIFSPAVTGIAMSLIGIAPGYVFLALLLLVSGISSTVYHIPTPVMVKKLSGTRIGKGMSFYMLGGELARTAGPMVIYGLISIWGLEGTYKMMPLGLIASAILYFRLGHVKISQDIKKQDIKVSKKSVYTHLTSLADACQKLYLPGFLRTAWSKEYPSSNLKLNTYLRLLTNKQVQQAEEEIIENVSAGQDYWIPNNIFSHPSTIPL